MGMLRNALAVATLATALAACGTDAVEPPPSPTPTTSSTPPTSPSATATPTPPVMPDAAKEHTAEGAKAFVVYYVDAITYSEKTLDTGPVKAASLPTCEGCMGGIKALNKIAKQGGHIEGAAESADAVVATDIDQYGAATVFFDLVNEPQRVSIPGKPTVLHPGGRASMLMTLVAQPEGGWLVSEFKDKP